MSELSDKVTQEYTNDLEHQRVTFLKYVAYGRRLQAEEYASAGGITPEQIEEQVKAAIKATAAQIFADIEKLDAQVTALQMHVEHEDEKEKLVQLKPEYAKDDRATEALARVDEIIKAVDQKHTLIMKDVRAAGFVKLKEQYL